MLNTLYCCKNNKKTVCFLKTIVIIFIEIYNIEKKSKMESNIPKYLLAESPVNNTKFEQYIYSARVGVRALIKTESVEMGKIIESADEKDVYPLFFVSKSTGLPEFYLFRIVDNIDLEEETIPSVLKDAGKWYKNFLIWEEKEMFEGQAEKPLLKDYSPKIKGLKIIVSRAENMWIFIFRGRVKVFSSDSAGLNWVSEEFNISKSDLSSGHVDYVEEIEEIIMEQLEDI